MNIDSVYTPSAIESKWYNYWLEHKLFASKPDERDPYTVVIPPPNVTGVLHMGHMLNNTIQDILMRHARLNGFNTCWVPGTDHASIATEAKVVDKLAKEGVNKRDLTREQFLEHAWDWTHTHGGIILEQLKRLGASCDWDRTSFTLDDKRSESVINVFCSLYYEGLIYRGVRIVNWDPKALTALSDEEVIHKEIHGKLYYLRYQIEGSDEYIIVATTRPETIMGDTAVCINPNDERYHHLKGKRVIVPIVGRSIPIIEDEYVDLEFGTGCLKVTPAHDINDYNLGIKHHLESINTFNDNGTLNEHGGAYANMDRFDVRKKIAQDLEEAGKMEKVEDYTNKVGYSERTDVPIEPKLSMQWFLNMEQLAKPALEAVENDTIKLVPAKFKNTYRHWMENIKDWCISRQLWWGHRIPAYYLPNGDIVVAQSIDEALAKAQKIEGYESITAGQLTQEEDCLDTWFSSWLWPMSVFDEVTNPQGSELDYYYPTAVLVTGPDILFFWVARMIMAGYHFKGQMPFKDVYLTGIVRDDKGRKMSKSLGNSPDPLDLIDKYGADAVRMGLMMAAPAGNDLLYDESLVEQGRNFCNKIWNSYRFTMGINVDESIAMPESSRIAIEWMESKIGTAFTEVEDLYSKYRLSEAMTTLYKLFRDDFSSFYLELIKPPYGEAMDKATHDATVKILDLLLRALHPFMPFITEELWQQITTRPDGATIMNSSLHVDFEKRDDLEIEIEQLRDVITNVRNVRNKHGVSPSKELQLNLSTTPSERFQTVLVKLEKVAINTDDYENSDGGTAATFIIGTTNYSIPLGDLINKEEMIGKLKKDLEHQEKFLFGVEKKLSNEKFMANAKPEVVAMEQKKKADSLSRIEELRKQIEAL